MDYEHTKDLPLLFSCSGGSSVGQVANEACRELVREGCGRLYCLAGVGGHIGGIVETAQKASTVIAVDGCGVKCALRSLEAAGINPTQHLVLTDWGMEKTPDLFPGPATIQSAKTKIKESMSV